MSELDMDQRVDPLVSIIIITYNSARFVAETLESARRQTYKNIELIISDDHSSDNTADVCKRWIIENGQRFKRTEFISSEINSGIPANCNRGLTASKGEWIKFVAGDDIIHDNCIECLIKVAYELKTDIIASRSQSFNNVFTRENFVQTRDLSNNQFFSKGITASQQFIMLLSYNYVDALSTIIKRELILSLGGFEERFRFIEDLPFWRKVTASGTKIMFCNQITGFYRIHGLGVSRKGKSRSRRVNYLLLDYAINIFDTNNRSDITIEERTIIARKYFRLLLQPYGKPFVKIEQLRKLLKYWPGLYNFFLLENRFGFRQIT